MSEPMSCPIDRTPLVMSERQGIEIDYCPTCRGVWLDRGELDKIIERSAGASASPPPPPPPQGGHAPQPGFGGGYGSSHGGPGYGHGGYGGSGYGHPHGKRKKSFLEEIFD
ncbi:MAG: hypothetical protein AVDCRST_MAG23-2160 [uncultured Sphingosinicella sp.]|uniref:Transcription factor zinc-finger domain-containing protein n=1 Tax=uncultured Sphingosinicella sp. TaxID=478748 RepID=A0A6J4U7N6_9SPHN|nr:zf-TFIIB domain-containing protein [uncultured Sphingosinicella sp.]CAA9542594.1 MAG: hypothetical protein AVDCRST_MAG23-2160 [uncultured Sphingosinicella sp.]